MKKPLEGIRVLDFSHSLAGPFASMIMANLGAEIIKVEPPEGDETRTWSPHIKSESAYFIAANRGLKSISIDLKREEGRDIVHNLAKQCDVVLENFRMGVSEKLGVDYHTMSKYNARIIYCSIKGFGSTSPYASKAAYDLIIQAMSGLMGTTGEEGKPPVRVSFALFDIVTGLFAELYILALLLAGKKPSYLEVSLFDAAIFAMSYVPMSFLLTGNKPDKMGSAHPSIVPYQAFRDRDGRFFVVAAANDRLWQNMCKVLGEHSLIDNPSFRTNQTRVRNRERLVKILQMKFSTELREHWTTLLEKAGVPASPVNAIDEVFQDIHVRTSGLLTTLLHSTLGEIPHLQPPVLVNGRRISAQNSAPTLGQHTVRLLKRFGYSTKTISSLKKSGVIR